MVARLRGRDPNAEQGLQVNDRLTLADGTVLLRDADGAPIVVRVSEALADAAALCARGDAQMARAVLMSMCVWLDQILARVEVALDQAEERRDN